MNREQRRRAAKSDLSRFSPHDQELIRKARNDAFTIVDLRKEHESGRREGYDLGLTFAIRTCYAAAVLAASETLGLDSDACIRFLSAMDERVVARVDSDEAIREVFDKLGVTIEFSKPFDRIQEKE